MLSNLDKSQQFSRGVARLLSEHFPKFLFILCPYIFTNLPDQARPLYFGVLFQITDQISVARTPRLLPAFYSVSSIVSTRSSPLPLSSKRNPAYDGVLCSADSILRARLHLHLPLLAAYWLMYQSRSSFGFARASWVKGGISYHLVRSDRRPQPPDEAHSS